MSPHLRCLSVSAQDPTWNNEGRSCHEAYVEQPAFQKSRHVSGPEDIFIKDASATRMPSLPVCSSAWFSIPVHWPCPHSQEHGCQRPQVSLHKAATRRDRVSSKFQLQRFPRMTLSGLGSCPSQNIQSWPCKRKAFLIWTTWPEPGRAWFQEQGGDC